jgi:cyclic pyranopterin phosphate synthase
MADTRPPQAERYGRALAMASALRPGQEPVQPAFDSLPGGKLEDRFGRRITYLRLSVTDRCNLRCEYCVPVSNATFLPRDELLTDDEIVRTLSVMAQAGLQKVRFTGGEPLVRPGVLDLIARVREIPGIRKLCVTTNGLALEEMGEALLERGVDHLNVSVDTLDPERFREITRGGDLGKVMRGIDHMLTLGARTLKVNVVLMRGVNDDQIERFVDLARSRPIEVRFIELMPLAHCGEIHDDRYVPQEAVLSVLRGLGAQRVDAVGDTDGPAQRYLVPGAKAPVGVISPVSESHFCDRCNRVRLSADGQFKLCLFGDQYIDLRSVLRGSKDDDAIRAALTDAMNQKPEKMDGVSGFTMMAIGG